MPIARKEDTPDRERRRKYEERHREERKHATKHFDTLIKSEKMDEINAFLEEHRITKVELVMTGYEALRSKYGPKEQENQDRS